MTIVSVIWKILCIILKESMSLPVGDAQPEIGRKFDIAYNVYKGQENASNDPHDRLVDVFLITLLFKLWCYSTIPNFTFLQKSRYASNGRILNDLKYPTDYI